MTVTTTPALVNFKHELDIDIDDLNIDVDPEEGIDEDEVKAAAKKLAKKLRRQNRDMMRAHFDYDGIRVELAEIRAGGDDVKGPTVEQAYELYYDEDADVA